MQTTNIAEIYENAAQNDKAGRYPQAEQLYKQVLKVQPDHAGALHRMGVLACLRDDYALAIEFFAPAIAKLPKIPDLYTAIALAFRKVGRFQEAAQACQQAISLKPDFADAYYKLGDIMRIQCRYDQAIANYKRVIQFDPTHIRAHNNLGISLEKQRLYDQAIECYKQAIRIEQDNADTTEDRSQPIRLKPDDPLVHFNLGMMLLLTGNFKDGWKEYETRRKTMTDISQPYWDGSSFQGKTLFVHAEQGIGDSFQFIRYLPMVKARGGTVIFGDRASTISLLHRFPGVDQLVEVVPGVKPNNINFDYHISLLSLPSIFSTTLQTIPNDVPYIHADTVKAEHWRTRLSGQQFKVGIVWAGGGLLGGAKHELITEEVRSCRAEYFEPLARIEGVRLYGLQKGQHAEQVNDLPEAIAVTNFGQQFEDFTDTAAAIENLDLIISIDTSVAHLAGAMGKPVWTLLPFASDWRWLLDRQDSPWYPTMTLFRQKKDGDWQEVFKRVKKQLQTLIAGTA